MTVAVSLMVAGVSRARRYATITTVSSLNRNPSFVARGGLWVAWQVPILIGAAALPVASGYGPLWPQHPLQWLGVVATVAGFSMVSAGLIALGDALTPFPRPRSDAALRTRGIYAWVRHPVYGGVIVATLGWALWWLSGLGALYAVLVFTFFDRKAHREERWLREVYPDYPVYQARVRKLIPGIY